MKKLNVFDMIGILFTFIGVIAFTVISVIIVNEQKLRKNGKEIEAVISSIESYRDSDGDINHEVYVEYSVDGNYYNNRISFYSTSMYEGKSIKIIYDLNNPNHIISKDGMTFIYIMFILPVVFLSIGLVFLIRMIKRIKLRKKLKRPENYVEANIEKIEMDMHYTVNGVHPYRIYCSYNGNLFISDHIYEEEKFAIERNNVTKIPVYVNHSNPKEYYVDIKKGNL